MSRTTPPAAPRPIDLVAFFALAAVGVFWGAVMFYRSAGIVGALYCLAMAWSRNIPMGIEGEPPSYYLRGRVAIAVGLLLTVACASLAWFAPEVACYLSEGKECR